MKEVEIEDCAAMYPTTNTKEIPGYYPINIEAIELAPIFFGQAAGNLPRHIIPTKHESN